MITDKELAVDILVKEHMAVCADDSADIEHMIRHGCMGLEDETVEALEKELQEVDLLLTYKQELAKKEGG